MAKDYTGWNGRKKRLEDIAAKREAAQAPARKLKSKNKTNGVKQRMDKAEALVCDMAGTIDRLIGLIHYIKPELKDKDDDDPRYRWQWNYKLHDAERMLKKAEKLLGPILEDDDAPQ